MNEEEKERLIKKDILSIENRVRHAFNQGYEMGLKERQNICKDAISRQAAIFLADELKQDVPDDERLADMAMAHNEGILDYQTQLSLLPSITPQEPCDVPDINVGDMISRQAVLEVIRKCHCEEWIKADIGAPIEALSPVNPQPCEDCISRQAVLEAFQMFRGYEANRTNAEWVERIETVVKKLLPVTPQPNTGHWIDPIMIPDNIYGHIHGECSVCHKVRIVDRYCANCGARMIEPQESEKVNCKSTKCENCINHNYCDYESRESEE